ncbi:leucyl/phenylalanyl-tRNA--protein transferase [Botrimarina sp.]|uniref:leucyl/phenylalanyl-tRNA--protein transferase n=1 Tax=Botrimarina sp. TaxID=2795802 RepID=UPI0032ECEE38
MSRSRQSVRPESRFPEPRNADREGLVAVGGRLDTDWLIDAYRHGIFPWPLSDDEPLLWWSPDPRAVIPLGGLRLSRRLRRTLRGGKFAVTANEDFAGVLRGCATGPGREEGTWLTPSMRGAYQRMHRAGYAHSIEVWACPQGQRELAGGLYGVAVGALFAAESMFRYQRDASKVALAWLVAHLNRRGYRLLDIQQHTPHTGSLGAVELTRDAYLDQVAAVVDDPVTFGDRLEVDPSDF